MGPLHIERRFEFPSAVGRAGAGWVGAGKIRRAILSHLLERRRVRQAKGKVGSMQIVLNRGRMVRVDDGDCLPAAVASDAAIEKDLIDAVSMPNLRGREANG